MTYENAEGWGRIAPRPKVARRPAGWGLVLINGYSFGNAAGTAHPGGTMQPAGMAHPEGTMHPAGTAHPGGMR